MIIIINKYILFPTFGNGINNGIEGMGNIGGISEGGIGDVGGIVGGGGIFCC